MAADDNQRDWPPDTDSVPRADVLVMCARPAGLAADEADEWLRDEAATLLLAKPSDARSVKR